MQCKICKNTSKKIFDELIPHKYRVDYHHCVNCGFAQTEEPYWLEEAYAEPINTSDIGYIQRNLFFAKRISIILHLAFSRHGMFMDYGGVWNVCNADAGCRF